MSLFHPLSIGALRLESNLLLAPLAGYTALAFRLMVREIGPVGLATTEVVAAKPLIERSRKTLALLRSAPGDRPLAVQVSAASPALAAEAARAVEAAGAAAVDLNLGCPVPKIARRGGGAALGRSAAEAAAVARAAVAAVRIPVTAKMRLGWAEGDLSAPEVARALEDAGIAAVAVHGRRRSQGFSGEVDLGGIAAVVRAVRSIPVIGNGDVTTPAAARRMLVETGCAGVLIGRAAVANPWIFRETRAFLEAGALPPPPRLEERLAAIRRHFALLARDEGEGRAALEFRKVLRLHVRALGGDAAAYHAAGRIGCGADLEAVLEALAASARSRPRLAIASAVPVPKGPVDLW
jgi:tRNA-dihydrouridine synthase B